MEVLARPSSIGSFVSSRFPLTDGCTQSPSTGSGGVLAPVPHSRMSSSVKARCCSRFAARFMIAQTERMFRRGSCRERQEELPMAQTNFEELVLDRDADGKVVGIEIV